MSTINFYLRKDKKTKEGLYPVVVKFSFENTSVKKSAGVKVLEKHWKEDKQRIKPNLKKEAYNNHVEYNKRLDEIEQKAKDIFRNAFENKITLNKQLFEKEWTKGNIKTKGQDIFYYFDKFIESSKTIKAKRTVMGHVTARNFLKEYSESKSQRITLDNFDLSLFEDIRTYAYKERAYSNNYFSTLASRFKSLMSWAFERGYHKNIEYKKFKAPEKPKEIICLYKDELFHLFNFEFENKRLERVRDVYCFGCFTGLRFSDIKDLKPEHIINDEIQKVIVKTKEFARIPLNKYALEIIDKYDDYMDVLPKISDQKFNTYIKEACKKAGIDRSVNVTKYIGGKVIQETVPKYQLITSHTARKTFTTNSLIFGMSETVVKKITGHKKEENFQRYVRLADNYIKEEINEAWK